ncbi:MAG: response regulator [Chlorobi bacterium]|nr:response regulator [Chlorobiota bacterium]
MKDLKILLVEDDKITNFLSKKVLDIIGITHVEAVLDGQKAIHCMNNYCPDLIYLDLNMPVMDGFEFLEAIKKAGFSVKTKVAILTSSDMQSDRDKAGNYPCVIDYIVKPLTVDKAAKAITMLD